MEDDVMWRAASVRGPAGGRAALATRSEEERVNGAALLRATEAGAYTRPLFG